MKTITLKLSQQDSRLMAKILELILCEPPKKEEYEHYNDGGQSYEYDSMRYALMFTVAKKYDFKLRHCTLNETVKLSLPVAYALAYKLSLDIIKNKFPTDSHQYFALQTYQQIDKAII